MKKMLLLSLAAILSAGAINSGYAQEQPKCKKECCKKCDDKCKEKCSKSCDDKKACGNSTAKA